MTAPHFAHTVIAGLGLAVLASTAHAACFDPLPLQFRADGTFRILQITDTQDDHLIDFRTPELIRRAIEEERPDLVVCSGDCITGGEIDNDQEVRDAIDAYITPVEEAGIPFLIAFGNHDEDAHDAGRAPQMDEAAQLEYYRNNYTCNINKPDLPNVTGTGESVTLVYGSQPAATGEPVPKLAVWTLDSGRYAPNSIGGQAINYNDNTWDWIRQDQVDWYYHLSLKLEESNGRPVPGIMFFHIPLFEFETMWTIDQGMFPSGDRPNPQPPTDPGRYGVTEERNECVCTGPFNSALFAAARERADIMGMFVGHDHINNYVGNYHGILLGYGASSGFGPYGFGGDERNRLRGVRVHDFIEDDVKAYVKNVATYFKRAGDDYGMCLAPDPADCNNDPYFPWVPSAALRAQLEEPCSAGDECKDGRKVGTIEDDGI